MTVAGPTAAHVLVVEDDHGIRDQLKRYLSSKGYWCNAVEDAELAIREMQVLTFDLLIVDILMPGMDGMSMVKHLRARGSDVPIILLTALGDLASKLDGFEAGADDYLSKPFEPEELVARIEALLRRAPTDGSETEVDAEVTFGGHRFDRRRGELWRGQEQVQITEGEIAVLRVLASAPNEPVDRSELLDRSEGHDEFSQNRAVDVRVSRLRQKIEEDPRRPRHLVTVRGTGYKLITY